MSFEYVAARLQGERDALQAQVATAHKINADLGEQSARDSTVLLRQGQQIRALQARIDATEGALRSVLDVGRTSGTNLNAWNEAFDIIDAALGVDPQKDRKPE